MNISYLIVIVYSHVPLILRRFFVFKPYIGIASVTSRFEAEELLKCLPTDIPVQLCIGVGVTTKTLKGKPTNHPNRLLPFDMIKSVFLPDDRVLNLVHFSTDEPQYLFRDVKRIYDKVGDLIGGIQVNLDIPDTEQLMNIWMLAGKDFRRIWQVRLRILKQYRAFKLLTPYSSNISDILLDVSLGRGVILDQSTIEEYIAFSKQVRKKHRELGIGVAGSLSAENVHELKPLFDQVGHVNIDAESKLRDEEDKLDIAKAQAFIQAASALYR